MIFFVTVFVHSLKHAFIRHLFGVSNTVLGIGKANKVEYGPCLAGCTDESGNRQGPPDRSDVISALIDLQMLM